MQHKFFSIIVVSLNPGEGLKKTLESIKQQTNQSYEIVLKDGMSTDGVLEELKESGYFRSFPCVRIFEEKDKGIYDAMNQAVKEAEGKYYLFLNCGDVFYDKDVLQNMQEAIEQQVPDESVPVICYGDQYNLIQQCKISSNPNLDDFGLFRNVPCHQVCFYDYRLFEKRGYNQDYTVRGDYEHFLYCVYEEHAKTLHIPCVVCVYEGGGYSETPQNKKRSKEQHKEITDFYMGKKAAKYRMVMRLSLAGLRTKMAESKILSIPYNAVKSIVYKIKG